MLVNLYEFHSKTANIFKTMIYPVNFFNGYSEICCQSVHIKCSIIT